MFRAIPKHFGMPGHLRAHGERFLSSDAQLSEQQYQAFSSDRRRSPE